MSRAIRIICNNKKANHNFFIQSTYEAGIALLGCEVKSVRAGGVSINDAFVSLKNGEVLLKNAYIKPYEKTTSYAPKELRNRKLLLHKQEIAKISRQVTEKGFTVVPTKVYLCDGLVKVEIGVAKGKKLYDKREVLKQKTIARNIIRESNVR
jgi:SsrA-binding protein